jgi:hypothetical protein
MVSFSVLYNNPIVTAGEAALDAVAKSVETVADNSGAGSYFISDTTLEQSAYDFTYKVFPSDISNDYIGHYVVFNINIPVNSLGSPRTSFVNVPYVSSAPLSPAEYSKVDVLRFGINNSVSVSGAAPGTYTGGEPLSLPRFTKRIKESIALYMPSPIVFSSRNMYQDISLTALAGGLGVGAAELGGAYFGGTTGASIVNAAAGALGSVIGTTSTMTGYPINPRIEVLYAATDLRQYVFEFLMSPRNEEESEAVETIIKTFRFHAAPELDTLTSGWTWIPPAEFDITFFDKGVENTHIPRINTCVLERVDVDYAPSGVYSTFRNGYPVSVRLSLGFREVEVVHKLRVLQGF